MQAKASASLQRFVRASLSIFIMAIAVPHVAYAQADPGPPPATAAAVPTMAQAKSFIERQISSATTATCEFRENDSRRSKDEIRHGTSINIDGPIMILASTRSDRSSNEMYPKEAFTIEDVNTYRFDVGDVSLQYISDERPASSVGCASKGNIIISCKAAACADRKALSTTVYLNGSPTEREESSKRETFIEFPIFDAALGGRIAKAMQFYAKASTETEGASPF